MEHPCTNMKKGAGLIELVIYGAILAVISVFVVNIIISISSVVVQVRLERNINTTADVIMQKLIREIRFANTVNPSTTYNVSPSALSLSSFVSDTDPTPAVVDFTLAGNRLSYSKGGASPFLLNANDVAVTGLIFRKITAPDISEGIKIELSLRATTSKYTVDRNFYSSAMLRGSY